MLRGVQCTDCKSELNPLQFSDCLFSLISPFRQSTNCMFVYVFFIIIINLFNQFELTGCLTDAWADGKSVAEVDM